MSNFWNEELSPGYYDLIVEKGLRKKRGMRSYWHITTLKKVLKNINSNSKHLDYACGPGTLIGLSQSYNSTGVDLSENQIRYAINKYSSKGEFYTLDQLDFKRFQKKFNIITVLGLIEFLEDEEIENVLIKLDNFLEIDGKIILTTPNFSGVMLILDILQNYFGKVNYKNQHINKFNKKKLLKFFNKFQMYEIRILNFLNISFLFSFFSHKLSTKLEKFISLLFKDNFGSIFLIELTKKS